MKPIEAEKSQDPATIALLCWYIRSWAWFMAGIDNEINVIHEKFIFEQSLIKLWYFILNNVRLYGHGIKLHNLKPDLRYQMLDNYPARMRKG